MKLLVLCQKKPFFLFLSAVEFEKSKCDTKKAKLAALTATHAKAFQAENPTNI